jgi:hypothetical protein
MPRAFERFAGNSALIVAALTFLYAIAFVVGLRSEPLAVDITRACVLMTSGIFTIAVFVGLYFALRPIDEAFSLLALLFGFAGGIGSAIHGAYDAATFLRPPLADLPELPNAVDPRGFLTFGILAIAIALYSTLMTHTDRFHPRLVTLGYIATGLLELIFVSSLIGLTSVLTVASLLAGFLIYPAWFILVGSALRRPVSQEHSAGI